MTVSACLKVASCNNDGTTQMYECKCSLEIKVSVKYILYMQFIVASALLRNSVFIEEWLTATTLVKYCTMKKLFLAINYKKKKKYL